MPTDNFIDGEELFNKSPTAIVDNSSKTFDKFEPGAIGSLAALICIICGIGYGGFSLFNQMQTVKISPSDASPIVLTEISSELVREQNIDTLTTSKISSDQLDRLYRPQALEVPVLTARDGPISTLDPSFSNNFDMEQRLTTSEIANNVTDKNFSEQVLNNNYQEASMLAALPKAPSKYNPYRYPDVAKFRRNLVLQNLKDNNFISKKQFEYAKERKPFGKALSTNQAIQFPLTELHTECEMIRNLVYKTAWQMDQMTKPEVAIHLSDKVSMCNYRSNRLVLLVAITLMNPLEVGVLCIPSLPKEAILPFGRILRSLKGF